MIDPLLRKRVRVVYERFLKPNIYKTIGKFLPFGKTTSIRFNEMTPSVYCERIKRGKNDFRITFGVKFLYDVMGYDNKKLSLSDFKKDLPNIKLVLIATYFHEVAHLLYTDMDDERIMKLPPLVIGKNTYNAAEFAHPLFNVLEDIVIEHTMSVKYKSSIERRGAIDDNSVGSLLKRNRKFILSKQIPEYVDNDDYSSLVNYLLLKLSLPSDFAGTNRFFDAHIENKKYVSSFLREKNGTARIGILIEYFNWLTTTELKFPEKPPVNPMESGRPGSKGISGTPMPTSGGATLGDGEGEGKGEGKGESKGDTDGDGETKVQKKELTKRTTEAGIPNIAGKSEEAGEELIIEPNPNAGEDDIFADLSDDDLDWSIHRVIDLKDFNLPDNSHFVDDVSKRVSGITQNLLYYFSLLKERKKPKFLGGLISGSHLDLARITRGEKLRVFKSKLVNSTSPLTGISLLCDNSGSMSGLKSVLLKLGVVAMADMMTKLDIPFSVHAFSDSSMGYNTFVVKDFDDNFDNPVIKNHFNMLSSEHHRPIEDAIEDACMFHGNEDAYHVEYLCRKLENSKLDKKILIIFSDGCPGDTGLLKRIVERHPGVHMIGIGLCDNSVKKFYPDCMVFNSEKELEELPKFLGNLLLDLIK